MKTSPERSPPKCNLNSHQRNLITDQLCEVTSTLHQFKEAEQFYARILGCDLGPYFRVQGTPSEKQEDLSYANK